MKYRSILAAVLILVGLGLTTRLAFAQDTQPPGRVRSVQLQEGQSEVFGSAMPVASDRYWSEKSRLLAGPKAPDTAPLAPSSSGGPDDYGYTWTDSVPFNWISAANGTDTGINNSNYSAGPINLGFNFKYYENSYSQLWVSRYGFVSFSSASLWEDQSSIPYPAPPNDVIAPHWVPAVNANYVRYLRGGAAPYRWFVMEWNGLVSDYDGDDVYTFQTVLYEDGTIYFYYATMNVVGNYWCQSSGIEDSRGIDGLPTSDYCSAIPGARAVRIVRPAPSARVRVFPQHYGQFVSPGVQATIEIPVRNTGDLGQDTFDVTIASRWPVTLFQSNGTTPLSDTDGDGVIDTGALAAGARTVVVAKIATPATSSVANSNQALLTFRSSRNTSKANTATLRTAVPSTFAQVFSDDVDNAMSLYLVRPGSQQARNITGNQFYGYDLSIVENSNGKLLYAWTRGRCVDGPCSMYAYEIEYALVDHAGNLARGVTKLTDHSMATMSTYDSSLVLAVAPDRRMGVLWTRELYDRSTGRWNDNIYFAVLSPTGDLLHGPVNLTNNSLWSGQANVPSFYNPRIVATGDNRFMVAWVRQHQETNGYVNDIWYAVWSTAANNIRSNTKLTSDTPGWDDYYEGPSLTAAPGNRVLMTLERQWDIYSAVFNSDGSNIRPLTSLTNDGLNWGAIDTVRTSDGSFVAAWIADPPVFPGQQPWTGRYFNNETLSGDPVLIRTDDMINFDWWDDSPHPLVNADGFSVRWDGTINVPAGKYRFAMGSDDGSRLWIDGQLVMDYWAQCCQYWYNTVELSAGAHQVRMEMHEHDGAAWAALWWWQDTGSIVRYLVLNPSFERIAGPVALQNNADLLGDYAVSVTADAEGSAILTWMDYSYGRRPNLYYALVDGVNGNVLTAPMIYRTSNAPTPYVFTSYEGNGNTSLVAQPWRVYLPLIAQPKDVCEPNDGLSQTRCPLKSGVTYRAYISSPGEWDFYFIDLPTDRVVEVWLQQIPPGHDYDLYLIDATNATIGYSANSGNADEYIRTAEQLPGGRYYVAVKGITGSSTTQAYSLRAVFR